MKKSDSRYLYFTVFMTGMSTLAVELTASRLLGPAFGVSNLVWASIIGLILIYLTLGYFIGGAWADRSPYQKTMYTILVWGAFLAGLVPLIAKPVLRMAADAFDNLQAGVLLGSFVAVLILFSFPVTLLGVISPFAIRLAIGDPNEAGSISGRIYATSTLGSFVGTFLPVLVLIPIAGTTITFLIFSIFLLLVALIGLWRVSGWKSALAWSWMLIILVIIAVYWGQSRIKNTEGQIYESESEYNYIQVLERDGYRYLRLNEGQGIHSIWHPSELNYSGPWEQFLVGPFFNPPEGDNPYGIENVKSLAIIGLAAGTLARQATAVFGPIPIDGFEIDPDVIEVGREYFDMNEPNLNAISQDGRLGLTQSGQRYTMIAVDAYRPPYIPWHMTTREFFSEVHDHLTEDGVLVINVGRAPNDRRLINDLTRTIKTIFPSVYVMDLPGSFNSIIYATAQPTDFINLFLNYEKLKDQPDTHPLLLEVMRKTLENLQPLPQDTQSKIYTDDWAPIELITNNMVLNFILSGGLEDIQ